MNRSESASAVPPTWKTLRSLYLTLFLRGRSARGVRVETAPTSLGRRLALTLLMYLLFGGIAFALVSQSLFLQSAYLHSMTFMFLGMFVASSAGEVLFNRDEEDILMHRPVATRSLLWAKVIVLAEVSIWLALAFNLCGLFVGTFSAHGHWLFFPVHIASTVIEAFFCTGCVVLSYQLCLRWFGRDRLESMMTFAQIAVSVGAVLGSQLMPELLRHSSGGFAAATLTKWALLFPPVWFAGIDDALAGSGDTASWILAVLGLSVTAVVLWLAFGRLVASYESGLQVLNETRGRRAGQGAGRRWLDRALNVPPLSWWIREPRERAAFLLSAAYLVRDRDVKLRVYPSVAPFLLMPAIFLFRETRGPAASPMGGFGMAFAGGYSGMVPLMALGLMHYSQHWQAADIFRVAPVAGPAAICRGTRKAVMLLIVLPVVLAMIGISQAIRPGLGPLLIMVPGLLLLPVLAMVPSLGGQCPLSKPPGEAKAAARGSVMIGSMMVTMLLSGLAMFASSTGWLGWLIAAELPIVVAIGITLERGLNRAKWEPIE